MEIATSLPKLLDSPADDSSEFLQWETKVLSQYPLLTTKPNPLPYPIFFETNEDLTWSKNEQKRICVKFNGLAQHIFEIYCDRHQLHYFQQFLQDQQTKRSSQGQHSTGLFLLRSARLIWRENQRLSEKRTKISKRKALKRGEPQPEHSKCPWNSYYLELQCTIDTCLLTHEGTQQVREEKESKTQKSLEKKEQATDLSENQLARIQSSRSSFSQLGNTFSRLSKPLYQGRTHILVGVSFGLKSPATVAVVDATTGGVLAYRSVRQLLTEDKEPSPDTKQPRKQLRLRNYRLLNRYRQRQQYNLRQRRQNQKRGVYKHSKESRLGKHLDRCLTKAIVSIAQK